MLGPVRFLDEIRNSPMFMLVELTCWAAAGLLCYQVV